MLRRIKRDIIKCAGITAVLCLQATLAAETFSLIALPDTQFYSANPNTSSYNGQENPFVTQVKWIVDNSESENIAFTLHLGDVVDNSLDEAQWEFSDQTMKQLDSNNILYGVCRGNHDAFDDNSFVRWFGPSRFNNMPTYKGSDTTGRCSYHIFSAGERKFLAMFLDWEMNSAEIEWAKNTLKDNSTTPTIIVSHELLYLDGQSPASCFMSDNGMMIWNELVKDNNQVFMTMCGHNHGTAWRVDKNSDGHDVLQTIIDYQMSFANGTGYLRQFIFDTANDKIDVKTFSPWVKQVKDNGFRLPPYILEEVTTIDAEFTIPMNFEARFAYCGDADHQSPIGDINHDCIVDIKDFSILADNWLENSRP